MQHIEYKQKVDLLKKYADAYYIKDEPLVTDDEYDRLYREVLEYEKNNKDNIINYSPTQRVGGVQSAFSKANHIRRMWSMKDIFNQEALIDWLNRVDKNVDNATYFCEPKFDGASLNIVYENGKLKQAITRGDGEIGEDVTQNVKIIRSVPLTIPYLDLIEIRGEVVIKKDDFEKINEERLKNSEPLFSNPRNAASGSLRQLNTSVTSKRKLYFYPWGIGENSLKEEFLSQKMDFIYSLGFLQPPLTKMISKLEDIVEIYNELINKRDEIPMMMDGMVIKVDSIALQEELGYTIKNPRWMAAYKFPAVEKSTTIKAITPQVGRTGVITPVAEVEAVEIEGATIERVTLHNYDEIERKDLKIGDRVVIIRSGGVIPKIIKPLISFRDGKEIEILRPTNCPICEGELLDEGKLIKCQNLKCPARVVNSIIYFASKKCLNIDGLGEAIVEELYKNSLLKNVEDLFFLTKEQLLELEGFKDKKATNLINSIESAKNCDCWRFINSLGIEHIGEVGSKKLCEKFGIDLFKKAVEDISLIDGFGVEMAESIVEFFLVNKDIVKELIEIINPKVEEKQEIKQNPFLNKKVVITGTLSKPRNQIKEDLENLGATISNSISKNTDFLICGENAGSKLKKANDLGVRVLSEEEFYQKEIDEF